MTQYIFRLASGSDRPTIRRLREQFAAEQRDPLGLSESSGGHSDYFLLEAAEERGTRAVGMMSLKRASATPFVFEWAFPDVWQYIDVSAMAGRQGLQRSDLVEADWGYLEQPYRGRHLALLLFAGMMLHAHSRGYPVCVAMVNPMAADKFPRSAFRMLGLEAYLAGVRYHLSALSPEEISSHMGDIVHTVRAMDPRIVWRLEPHAA